MMRRLLLVRGPLTLQRNVSRVEFPSLDRDLEKGTQLWVVGGPVPAACVNVRLCDGGTVYTLTQSVVGLLGDDETPVGFKATLFRFGLYRSRASGEMTVVGFKGNGSPLITSAVQEIASDVSWVRTRNSYYALAERDQAASRLGVAAFLGAEWDSELEELEDVPDADGETSKSN